MSLPNDWIKPLFERMAIRYGQKFIATYTEAGVTLEAVMADWADYLDGVPLSSLQYAMVNLPLEWPPTVMQFLDICRRAPLTRQAPALPEPKPDPEIRAAGLAALMALRGTLSKPLDRGWIERLKEREEAGEILDSAQRDALAGIDEVTDVGQDFAEKQRTRALQEQTQKNVDAFLLLNPHLADFGWDKDRRDAHQARLVREGKIK